MNIISTGFMSRPVFAGEGGSCPRGHYCPAGSPHAHVCPAGTYNNLTHQPDCLPCPAGYFCAENTSDYNTFPCPAGFYCPEGTQHSCQFPCPRGYYNPDPRSHSIDSCLPCISGHYCGAEGLSTVSGKCDPGWFCVFAAWTPQPFDLDNYTSANCLCPATSTGGKCLPSFYCPEGATEPISCPPGYYCENAGLAAPSGECAAGFYCTGRAKTSKPTDALQGNICPPGTFCPNGSQHPQLCPAGTFSADYSLGSVSECKPCPPGLYCSGSGIVSPTGQCPEGYYCPEGQTQPDRLPCPSGHRCTAGSSKPLPCESGFYQNEETQTTCQICEAAVQKDPMDPGKACPASGIVYCVHQGNFVKDLDKQLLQGTVPLGTGVRKGRQMNIHRMGFLVTFALQDIIAQKGQDHHSPVLPAPGQTQKVWEIDTTADPVLGGHFAIVLVFPFRQGCVHQGYSLVLYYTSSKKCEMLSNLIHVILCSEYSLYYCSGGAEISTPVDGLSGGLCPPGHFCLSGSSIPILCSPGSYMIRSGATECDVCPAGKYCVPGMSPQPCPRGFYCPQRTSLDWKPCPPGSYSSDLGLSDASGCRLCDGGKYCPLYNSTTVNGDCAEGYYCISGAQRPDQEEEIIGSAGPCPPGHFCPRGSVAPTPCPIGTFSSRIKLLLEAECSPCAAGHHCDSPGLVLPAGPCSEGFYCILSAISPHLFSVSSMGGPCPSGHFCPIGSSAPQPCPPGTFNPMERQGICLPCTEGFFCLNKTSSLDGKVCPPGFYCPGGTVSPEQFPCPRGTYNPHRGSRAVEDCWPCDPGHYCDTLGQTRVTGLCSEGYFCVHSVITSTPNQGTLGDVCPSGYYCPVGSVVPHPCPFGSYSNSSGNVGPEACVLCEPGYFCDRPGLAAPNGPCDEGYYCTRASVSPHPAEVASSGGPCPAGHFCPQGSHIPHPCPAGTFSQYLRQSSCSACPEGFYCPVQSTNTSTCPEGYYCPRKTEFAEQHPCPLGTFSGNQGAPDIGTCLTCPPGMFCSRRGLGRPEGFCAPGWFCPAGSISDKPVYSLKIPEGSLYNKLIKKCPTIKNPKGEPLSLKKFGSRGFILHD
ncbi:uncharacterized protein K04H4.2-like [Ranitomeya imitator]|uniref:uncharacterized protein K04H4.2-like n=1 Tax=Ranitomeya imitator TaxID=111125 RepID=UPI0037E8EF67